MVLLTVRALPKVYSDAFSATMPGKAKEILPTLQAPYTFWKMQAQELPNEMGNGSQTGTTCQSKNSRSRPTNIPSLTSLPQPHFSSFFLRGMHGSCSELIQHIFIFFCMNWSVGKNYSKKNAKVRAVITSTFIYSNIVRERERGERERERSIWRSEDNFRSQILPPALMWVLGI